MKKSFAVLGAVVGAAACHAGPTALLSMPIADILGHRNLAYTYGVSGFEKKVDPKVYHAHGLTLGAFDRIEFGFDNDFSGNTTWNAKLLLIEEPKDKKWAVSAGVFGWRDGDGAKYVVGRYDLPNFRFHGGWQDDTEGRAIFGFDGPIGDATWVLEHRTGTGAVTWAGFSAPINIKGVNGLSVMAGVGVPNRKDDGVQYYASITWGVKF